MSSAIGDDAADDAGNGSPMLDISPVGYDGQNNDGVITTSVGSLVSGACRRVVFRLNLPPARSRSQATLTLSVSWRDDGGETCTSDAQQIVLRIDPAHSVARDREVALLAAQAWLDETIRRGVGFVFGRRVTGAESQSSSRPSECAGRKFSRCPGDTE